MKTDFVMKLVQNVTKKIFFKIIYTTLPIIKNFWLKTGFQLK